MSEPPASDASRTTHCFCHNSLCCRCGASFAYAAQYCVYSKALFTCVSRKIAPSPDPGPSPAALRALIAQWREEAERCSANGISCDSFAYTECADQLAALLEPSTKEKDHEDALTRSGNSDAQTPRSAASTDREG